MLVPFLPPPIPPTNPPGNFNLPGGLTLPNPAGFNPGFNSIGGVLTVFYPYVLIFGGLIVFLMLILAGFEIMTAAGNEEQMQSGTTKLTNALIGFGLLMGSYWIAQIAQVLFKIQIL